MTSLMQSDGRISAGRRTDTSWDDHLTNERARYLWARFCSFIGISVWQFLDIQEQLLSQQLALIQGSALGRSLLRRAKPRSVKEFRALVPVTGREDYGRHFMKGDGAYLNEPPAALVPADHADGLLGPVAYTQRALDRSMDAMMSAMVLAAARARGDVRVGPGATVLVDPSLHRSLEHELVQRMASRYKLVVLDTSEELWQSEPARKQVLAAALSRPVHVAIGTPEGMAEIGREAVTLASRVAGGREPSAGKARIRSTHALWKSLFRGRTMLPRDLWAVRAVIDSGYAAPGSEQSLHTLWGTRLAQTFACAEGGIMGMQTWEGCGLIFNPYADFFEFIPLDRGAHGTAPAGGEQCPVLLNEVQPRREYEVVITSFYGMPFVRYRTGRFVRFLSRQGVRPLPFEPIGRVPGSVADGSARSGRHGR